MVRVRWSRRRFSRDHAVSDSDAVSQQTRMARPLLRGRGWARPLLRGRGWARPLLRVAEAPRALGSRGRL